MFSENFFATWNAKDILFWRATFNNILYSPKHEIHQLCRHTDRIFGGTYLLYPFSRLFFWACTWLYYFYSVQKQKNSSVGEKRKHLSISEDEEVDDMIELSDNKENSSGDDDSDIDGKAEGGEQSNSDEDREEAHEEPKKQKPSERSSAKKSTKKESGDYEKSKAVKKDGPVKSPKSSGKDAKKSSSSMPKKVASVSDSIKSKSSKKQKVEKESEKVGDASAKEKASSKSSANISKNDPGVLLLY